MRKGVIFQRYKMGQNPIKKMSKVRSFHTCVKFDYKHSLKCFDYLFLYINNLVCLCYLFTIRVALNYALL